ncbi:MAG: ABC transporter permease [Vicinamibacterales bacterium]
MQWLRRLGWLVRDLVARRRFERDLDEELQTWVALAEEDARGRADRAGGARRDASTGHDARRRAVMALGGVEPAREAVRDARRGAWLSALAQDVRLALRRMRRQPGFSLVAVLTLALGIGANTAILSAVQSVLLRPLPFPDSDHLVRILTSRRTTDGREEYVAVLPTWYHAIRERSTRLAHVTAQRYRNLILTGAGDAEPVAGIGVSAGWSDTLAVRPLAGRGFLEDELAQGDASRVVLVSAAFRRAHFATDADAIGRTLRLNDTPYTVVGVMPPAFHYPYNTDVWLPMTVSRDADALGDLNVAARLAPGATVEDAQAELSAIAAEAARTGPPRTADLGLHARPMAREFRRDPNRSLAVLTAGVALVLVLACVNLTTLLLARAATRRREMAVRTALGAGPGRQLRQLLTESVVLAAAGGTLGVALAWLGADRLSVLIPSRLGEVIQTVSLDGRVLAAAVVLCVASGVLAGLAPALRLSRTGLSDVLRDGTRPGARRGGRLLRGLVIGEMALATVLLVGAGLLARHVVGLLGRDVGYDPARLVRISLTMPEPAYTEGERRAAVVGAILDRVRAVPGLEAAAMTSLQPIPHTSTNVGTRVAATDRPATPDATMVMNFRLVTPGYFETLGLPARRGRTFDATDAASSEPVMVVSAAAARRLWPEGAALDRFARVGEQLPRRVVGVVGDQAEPDDDQADTVYIPYAQGTLTQTAGTWSTTGISLLARLTPRASTEAVLDGIRAAVREVDGSIPAYDAVMMPDALAEPLADQRLGAVFVGAFGAFGLLLAALGLYGTLAYSVSQRTSEFGIRMALGARRGRLLRGVLADGLRLVATGLAFGAVAAFGLVRVLAGLVAGLDARDPGTWVVSAGVLVLVGVAACALPAWRAIRVDPIRALRAE